MARTVLSHREFRPFYLRAHSKPATRGFHCAGTAGPISVAPYAAWTGAWWWLLAPLAVAHVFAWFSHFVIERNKPATFNDPLWSLVSGLRMMALAASGAIGAELEKCRIRPRA